MLISGRRAKAHCQIQQILGSTFDWPAGALHLSVPMLRDWRIGVVIVGFLMLRYPRYRQASGFGRHFPTLLYLHWRWRHHISTTHGLRVVKELLVRLVELRFALVPLPFPR
jgi:hypothetical protein